MNKYKKRSPDLRELIVAARKNGESYGNIAQKFNISKQGAMKIVKKFEETGVLNNLPGQGPKRKTTPREDSRIIREIRRNPEESSSSVRQSLQLNVSSRTVCRRWNEAGLKNYLCLRKPLISNKNKKKRLKFAKKHINKPDTFWNNVIWSDESKFELFNAKKRKRVWRKPNEGLKDVCIQSTVKHGGGNVLVWEFF